MGRLMLFYGPLVVWIVAAAVFFLFVIDRRGRFSLTMVLVALSLGALILGIFAAGAKYADWLATPT
jgi:hypothetical protein